MKALVTGYDGYIGAVLVSKLLERGHEVKGIDVGYFDRCDFIDKKSEIQSTRKDIRDLGIADVRGFDVMIHLAALSNDPLGELDPNLTLEINGKQSFRLAQLAKQAGIGRFIFASSCSVYGFGETGNLPEETPMNPQSVYARSKILAEQAIGTIADGDFSPTYLRCATVYGLYPKMRFDLVVTAVPTASLRIKSSVLLVRRFPAGVHAGRGRGYARAGRWQARVCESFSRQLGIYLTIGKNGLRAQRPAQCRGGTAAQLRT